MVTLQQCSLSRLTLLPGAQPQEIFCEFERHQLQLYSTYSPQVWGSALHHPLPNFFLCFPRPRNVCSSLKLVPLYNLSVLFGLYSPTTLLTNSH